MLADLAQLPDDELLALSATRPEAFGEFYERHVREELGPLDTRFPRLELIYADGTTRVATFR